MKYSEERKFFINALFFIISIASMFVIPIMMAPALSNVIKNKYTLSLLADFVIIIVLYLMYMKDIHREAKIYFGNFKECFNKSVKYYVLGLIAMIFFNLFVSLFLNGVSDNENTVRELLFNMPVYTMFNIIIIAPLTEEMIFRKSLAPLVKNKWVYATICGILFGAAHLLSGEFVPLDLLYILPYGSLGFAFAIMDYETKSTFSSIVIHAIHNGCTGILLLLTYFLGVL